MVLFGVVMKHVEKRKELERRRRHGARLLAAGHPQAEAASQVGVSRRTAMRWERLRRQGGLEARRRAEHSGHPGRLCEWEREELVRLLKAGSPAVGFATELWTLLRIARVIEDMFSVSMVSSSVWRLLGRLGWSVQRPSGEARERDEPAIRGWKAKKWPAIKNRCATRPSDRLYRRVGSVRETLSRENLGSER
jgi:transposase